MSEPQTLPAVGPQSTADPASENVPDPAQFDAIVQAAFGDTARSSGSLESNASSSLSADAPSSSSSTSTSSTSQSVPSLTTSSTTSSTTASAASSKTPSPCPSILRSNSAPPSAFPTLSSMSPNVTFAPLPQTEPRKRNSSHPLGVAARSRLLRHRRMLRERGLNPDDYQHQYQYQHEHQYQYEYGPGSGVEGGQGYPADGGDPHPYGEDGGAAVEFPEMAAAEGTEEHVRVRRARTASDAREEEDPFVALGKLVKGAGKTLWKSLSMRDLRAKEREAAKAIDKEKGGVGADGQPRASQGDEAARRGSGRENEKEAVPRRHIVGTGHLFDDDGVTPRKASAEGGVWEEEVAEDSWKKLLSKSTPVPDTANGDGNDDGQTTPTPASVESAGGATVLTTIVAAQLSTKAR